MKRIRRLVLENMARNLDILWVARKAPVLHKGEMRQGERVRSEARKPETWFLNTVQKAGEREMGALIYILGFFNSLITIAILKHVGVAFRIFTRKQMVTDLVSFSCYFFANTSPLSSYPEAAAAAGKITG